jgi:D-arabinose 1-dehydrogenase-like Zn-dependent alcohol dehydrogenase
LGKTVLDNSRIVFALLDVSSPFGQVGLPERVILTTAPSAKAMSTLIDGLGTNGKLLVVGVDLAPIDVTPRQLISGTRTIEGWVAGKPIDTEDAVRFADLTGVRALIETYPLEKAAEAYARMMSGEARFRVVLTM